MSDRLMAGIGWWGYFICAVLYVISGLKAGDWMGLTGSVLFMSSTVCFLVLFYRRGGEG